MRDSEDRYETAKRPLNIRNGPDLFLPLLDCVTIKTHRIILPHYRLFHNSLGSRMQISSGHVPPRIIMILLIFTSTSPPELHLPANEKIMRRQRPLTSLVSDLADTPQPDSLVGNGCRTESIYSRRYRDLLTIARFPFKTQKDVRKKRMLLLM